MPEASPVVIVNARLTTERHPLLQDGLVAFGNPWGFVCFEADTMSGAVFQKLLETSFADLVKAHFVDLFGDRSLFKVVGCGIVRREHGVIEFFCIVARHADAERALAFHVISADLRAQTENQRVSSFQLVFAGDSVREGGSLAERYQATEGRIDADAH